MDHELITKYRDINVEYEWWEYTEQEFRQQMDKFGIEVDKIYFSGFWSQGDGACFEGRINKPLRFLRKHFPTKYPMMRKLLAIGGDVKLYCGHSGHYSHQNSTSFVYYADHFKNLIFEEDDDLRTSVIEVMDEQLNAELEEFEEAAAEVFRDYMRGLYRDLETEYEHLTSDEAVWEAIVANDLHLPELIN
jgi:hypothetical protein